MKLSSKDMQEIYLNEILVENDVMSVTGGSTPSANKLVNTDDWNEDDNRIPYVIGKIQTRKGSIKGKKNKKLKKYNNSKKLPEIMDNFYS